MTFWLLIVPPVIILWLIASGLTWGFMSVACGRSYNPEDPWVWVWCAAWPLYWIFMVSAVILIVSRDWAADKCRWLESLTQK